MNGLLMDFQLTLPAIMRRTDQLFGHKEIVTRLPDKSYHRYTYADMIPRAKQLALALENLSSSPGTGWLPSRGITISIWKPILPFQPVALCCTRSIYGCTPMT